MLSTNHRRMTEDNWGEGQMTDGPAREAGPIVRSCAMAMGAMDELDKTIQQLKERLGEVMGPDVMEKSPSASSDVAEPGSPVTNSFRDVQYRAEQMSDQLNHIMTRLEC